LLFAQQQKLSSSAFHVQRSSMQNSFLKFTKEKSGRVAFMGGSITEGGGWRDSVCAHLQQKFPDTYILIMTGDLNEKNILKALENGAKGYVNKPFEMEGLIKAMNKTFEDGSFLSPVATTSLLNLINNSRKPSSSIKTTYSFTMKESEIVELLRQGMSYNEIAEKLKISYHTVNHHIKNIYHKMDVNSKSKLIAEINNTFKN
jgi:DNA-binding NarL/FixJ family response regulator